MKRAIIIIGLGIVVIALFVIFKPKASKVTNYTSVQSLSQNVTTSEGKQIIEITAKGGYAPRMTTAKANVPTILRIKTNSTFDCSSALRIPTLAYSNTLPATGVTDIEVPNQAIGTTLRGVCSMGMYHFEVSFVD